MHNLLLIVQNANKQQIICTACSTVNKAASTTYSDYKVTACYIRTKEFKLHSVTRRLHCIGTMQYNEMFRWHDLQCWR